LWLGCVERMKKLLCIFAVALIIFGAIFGWFESQSDTSAQKAVEETRQNLRQQGFKTDLSDFDFSTSSEMRAREAILKATAPDFHSEPFHDHPNLMEIVGSNSVIVVWKQDSLERANTSWPVNNDMLTWAEFREALQINQTQVDAACGAVMSGPIGFNLDARGGNAVKLPHLAVLKNLTQMLGSRSVLDLHDGNLDAAWTNLMVATRLVTAWEPEPAEVSQLVRFGNTTLAFNVIWQALQTNDWSDDKLAQLQREWEGLDFFKHLPETMAFKRASSLAAFEQERNPPADERFSLAEFSKEMFRHPLNTLSELKYIRKHSSYLKHGIYEDETNSLIFYRDREVELRNAIQAKTWLQMRQLPGVTNEVLFQSTNHSRTQVMMNLHHAGMRFQEKGAGFLGRAADAEARRRILITAIALERYRQKLGSYPQTLAELEPDFLKNVPVDFMDGQPLRYRLTADGHFLLYSIGLDCVDNGGIIQTREQRIRANREAGLIGIPPEADIVWPLPVPNAVVVALRQEQLAARQNKAAEIEELQAHAQWEHAAHHQADVEKLLAAATVQSCPDLNYHGRPLSEILRNQNSTGTNRLTLGQMLALKQIITGDEPETITFEVAVAYDVVTNLGNLYLYIDPTNNDDSIDGCNVQQMEYTRADNGDCRLAWSTIYESPGKHALQIGLLLNDMQTNDTDISGPLLPFVITNLCQFSLTSAHFDQDTGATFHAKLPEANGNFTIELNTTNGTRLKTITGSTTNGVIKVHWDLIDEHGQRFTNDFFNSVFHIELPDSGRTQTLKGP